MSEMTYGNAIPDHTKRKAIMHPIKWKTISTIGVLLVLATPAAATAQGLVTPVAHWGGYMLPSLEPGVDWTVHFLDFTQFGKEFDEKTNRYVFTPYNDIDKTLGFNIVSRSSTNIVNHHVLTASTLTARTTYFAGLIDDRVPRFLQNEVIHRGNLRQNKLQPVPRHIGDTPETISLGPTEKTPILGLSQEYFMRMHYTRDEGGYEERVLAPYFIGGGFSAGTVNQEMFFHGGVDVAEFELPQHWQHCTLGVRGLGFGGMARIGVLAPGPLMPDLTAQYSTAQGVIRVLWAPFSYPIRVDFAMTSHEGYFVAKRTPEERQTILELPRTARDADVYQAKTPMRERYLAMRVGIGNLTFETYNDSYGGKDKGPSYGVQVSYHVAAPVEVQSDRRSQPRLPRR
jgi:hypothetical protein